MTLCPNNYLWVSVVCIMTTMRTAVIIASLLIVLAGATIASPDSFDEAKTLSLQQEKPILLEFVRTD